MTFIYGCLLLFSILTLNVPMFLVLIVLGLLIKVDP